MGKGFVSFISKYIGFYILWRVAWHLWKFTYKIDIDSWSWISIGWNIVVCVAIALILLGELDE